MNQPTPEMAKQWLDTALATSKTNQEIYDNLATLAYQAGAATGFGPGDMADAAAKSFRDGHAAALAELRAEGVELPLSMAHNDGIYLYGIGQLKDYGDRRAAAAVPEGWVLVPKEPTPNMYVTAGTRLTQRIKEIQATGRQIWSSDEALARLVYEVMIATAPTPPKGGV